MKAGRLNGRRFCKGAITIETVYFLFGSLLLISFLFGVNKMFSEKALVERQSHSLASLIRDQKRIFGNQSTDLLKNTQVDVLLNILKKEYPNRNFDIEIKAQSNQKSQVLSRSSFSPTCISDNMKTFESSTSWNDFRAKMLSKNKTVYIVALCSQVNVVPFVTFGFNTSVGSISFASSRRG